MSGQPVQVLRTAAGEIRHVATSSAPWPDPARPLVSEIDPSGAPVALVLELLDLDDGADNPPPRMIRAQELLEALELDSVSRAPRFKPDAPAELRGLRLRSRLPVDPDRPGTPPPELMTLAAAPAPSMWRRVRSWWA